MIRISGIFSRPRTVSLEPMAPDLLEVRWWWEVMELVMKTKIEWGAKDKNQSLFVSFGSYLWVLCTLVMNLIMLWDNFCVVHPCLGNVVSSEYMFHIILLEETFNHFRSWRTSVYDGSLGKGPGEAEFCRALLATQNTSYLPCGSPSTAS